VSSGLCLWNRSHWLIGHNACWPDGLRALAELASNPGLKGGFLARLDYQACCEIKFSNRHRGFACVRPLHSGIRVPETVLSTDGQITDSVRSYLPLPPVTIAPKPVMTPLIG